MKPGGSPPEPTSNTRSSPGRPLLLPLALGLVCGASAGHAGGLSDIDAAAEASTRPTTALPGPAAADRPSPQPAPQPAGAPEAPPPQAEAPDPRARLPKGGKAVEYWDLTTEFESGHHLFVRFAITNEGPGDQLGFATGELVGPDGKATHFRNGRQKSRWTLSSDGLRLDIGKSHLDLHGPRYRLEVVKSYVKIDISFAPRAGTRAPEGLLPQGYVVDLLALASPTEGTIWLKGTSNGLKLQGRSAAVHTVVRKSETKLVQRRIELFSQARDAALYVADFAAPSGNRSRWIRAVAGTSGSEQPEQLISETAFDIELGRDLFPPGKKGSKQTSRDYWVPGHLELRGSAASGQVTLTGELVQRDPLSDLPRLLRFLAGSSSKPRRVWSTANFAVTLQPGSGPTPLQFQSRGAAAINFTNPLTRR